MLLSDYQIDKAAAHQGASKTPQRRGGFALLGCSTNSAFYSVMDFPTGLTPPKIGRSIQCRRASCNTYRLGFPVARAAQIEATPEGIILKPWSNLTTSQPRK